MLLKQSDGKPNFLKTDQSQVSVSETLGLYQRLIVKVKTPAYDFPNGL